MYNLKNVVGLPVLSLYEGELIGNVTKIYFNENLNKIISFSVSGEGDISYTLLPKSIYKIGKNAITIKNNSSLALNVENFGIASPLNYKTYSIQGEYLGKLDQITFRENYSVDSLVLDSGKTYLPDNLFSCGKNTIIIREETAQITNQKFKQRFTPKFFKSKEATKVSALPIEQEENEPDILEIKPTHQKESEDKFAENKTKSSKFLIGRTALQTIMLDEKNILIKANSTITEKIISLACTNNKLRELMTYSRQK